MKKAFYTLILVMLLGVNYGTASTPENHEPKAAKFLTSQIHHMLGEFSIPDEIRGSKAEVRWRSIRVII